MSKMKKLMILVIALFLMVCGKYERSPDLYEEGKVTHMEYFPPKTSVSIYTDGEGQVRFRTHEIPERYMMSFSCQHGEFEISSHHAKQIFHSLRVGDDVIITYAQIDRIETDENDKEIGRVFHSWDFITAKKIDPNGPKEKE